MWRLDDMTLPRFVERRSPSMGLVFGAIVPVLVTAVAAQMNSVLPTVRALTPAFDRIWNLSLEKEPFQSIKGKFDPTINGWRANVDLPGASSCHIRDQIEGRQIAGTDRALPVYECTFAAHPDEGEKALDRFLKLIQALNRNWRTMPALTTPVPLLRTFEMFHEHFSGTVIFVSLSDEDAIQEFKRTTCYQPRHLSVSWSKVYRSEPTALLGLQVFPPSQSPAKTAPCPTVY